MIITISGAAGAGKSTIAKAVAERLGFKHHSSGDFMGEIAMERGISLLELSRMAEKDKAIDMEIDERQRRLGVEEDNFVIDSRLGFYFIPKSIKIFLDVDINEGARRIFNDRKRRKDEPENTTLEKTRENLKERNKSNKKRYLKYYGIDYLDSSNYDFVLDTTGLTIEKTVNEVMRFINKNKERGRKKND